MIDSSGQPRARAYIERLQASGRYLFSSRDAQAAVGASPAAAKLALNRLAKQDLVASPARGFYVIVPPEYRSLGCLPADQFIPELMERLGLPYYAGLLSAAEYHGAAHHRPQEFQVFLDRQRRPLACGRVRVQFFVRKHLANVPTQSINTRRGTIVVSTPEATALDLVGHHAQAGGFRNAVTVLSELAERLDAKRLPAAAEAAPVAWAQRLGYVLEQVRADSKTALLEDYVQARARVFVPLISGAKKDGGKRSAAWKVLVNTDVEPEA